MIINNGNLELAIYSLALGEIKKQFEDKNFKHNFLKLESFFHLPAFYIEDIFTVKRILRIYSMFNNSLYFLKIPSFPAAILCEKEYR